MLRLKEIYEYDSKGRIKKHSYLEIVPSKRFRNIYRTTYCEEFHPLNDSGTLNRIERYEYNKWSSSHLERNVFDKLGNRVSHESYANNDSSKYSIEKYYDNKSGKIDSFIFRNWTLSSVYKKVIYHYIDNKIILEVYSYNGPDKLHKIISNITVTDSSIQYIDSIYRGSTIDSIYKINPGEKITTTNLHYISGRLDKEVIDESYGIQPHYRNFYYSYYPSGLLKEIYNDWFDEKTFFSYEYYK